MTRRVVSLVLLVAAGLFTAASLQLDFSEDGGPGVGFYPTIVGLALVGLCIVNVLSDFMSRADDARNVRPRPTAIVAALGCLYIILFGWLGALVASVLFAIAGAFVVAGKLRARTVIVMVAVPIAIILLVQVVMRQSLPQGFLSPVFG